MADNSEMPHPHILPLIKNEKFIVKVYRQSGSIETNNGRLTP